MDEITLDPQRQVRAREYARIQRWIILVDLILGAVYLAAWLGFGWSVDLKIALLQWTKDVKTIADACQTSNPRFDRYRFYQACGLINEHLP